MPKNAAIFASDPSILGSRLFDRLEDVLSYEGMSQNGNATGVRFTFQWGSVTMTFMPAEKIDAHLDGFSGYARHVINDHDKLIYTLSRIRNVRMPLGCAVEHGEKDEDAAICFLFAFNSAVNGLLFMYDSIFDWSGEELGSPAETE